MALKLALSAIFMALLALPAAAACTGSDAPWLNSEYVVYCESMNANTTCFAVVSENTTGLNVETVREWKSPNEWVVEPQPLTADSEGRLAYSFFLDAGRYLSGAKYDVNTYCGNLTGSLQFQQQDLMPPAAAASYAIWLRDAGGLVVGGLVLAGFMAMGVLAIKRFSGW